MGAAYNFYVFNREGVCLFYAEWRRPKPVSEGAGSAEDDAKMMFGLTFSLKNFCTALDPAGGEKGSLGTPVPIGTGCQFRMFKTNSYKLNYLETPTGIKIILNTAPDAGDLQGKMWEIYRDLYCEYVVKNPLYTPGRPFKCVQFTEKLDAFVSKI